ncbi:MAG: hypothetical protein P1P85_04285 [Patescibacteria group bacterium]|nr:hypothetical protein [Patescibacteria group bacterium]
MSSQLQNRFPENLKYEWQFWNECMVCGKNGWDALHHIITPANSEYISGEHNKSILNSCPIHNFRSDESTVKNCHISNESELHKQIPNLLCKTIHALVYEQNYKLKKIDKQFFSIYSKFYGSCYDR